MSGGQRSAANRHKKRRKRRQFSQYFIPPEYKAHTSKAVYSLKGVKNVYLDKSDADVAHALRLLPDQDLNSSEVMLEDLGALENSFGPIYVTSPEHRANVPAYVPYTDVLASQRSSRPLNYDPSEARAVVGVVKRSYPRSMIADLCRDLCQCVFVCSQRDRS
jgi:hypothetical protein